MKYDRILTFALAAAILCSCVEELGRTEYKPHQPRPAKDLISVEVIASIDTSDMGDARSVAPGDFDNMQPLWQWDTTDVVYARYEVDRITDLCASSSVKVDAQNPSRASIVFDGIPYDARIVGFETGSTAVFGKRIALGEKMDKSTMAYLAGKADALVGQTLIDSVVLGNECAYLRVAASKVTMSGIKFPVSKITVAGNGVLGGNLPDDIVLSMNGVSDTCLVAVSNAATDVTVLATFASGDKMIANYPAFTTMPLVCKVEDTGDESVKMTVNVTATLDAASRSLSKTTNAALADATPRLWQWNPGDVLVAEVIVNGYEGTVESDAVAVDPADSNKAVFTFTQMPADAKVTGLVFGDESAYARTCPASGAISRNMIYARASVSSTIGKATITGVDMKHQCSYLNVFADSVVVEDVKYCVPSFSVSGVGIKGDGQAATINVFNPSEGADSVWVAVSSASSSIQVVANTSVSGAMILNLPSLGGLSLFKVRAGTAEKVTYRTALYADGTFIINEMSTNSLVNTALHGALVAEYPALKDSADFCFSESETDPVANIWSSNLTAITAVEFGSATQPRSMAIWFKGAANLKSFNSSNLDLSLCKDFTNAFANCSQLVTIDTGGWDVSSATNMMGLFDGCEKITSLSTTAWNTSKVKDMHYMFRNCKTLATLDVSGWDVSNVTTFKFTFQSCAVLKVLDVSKWNTSSVKDLQGIFRDCTSIQELDVADWDVSKVTDMFQTFYGLKITTLDIGKWNTGLVARFENTFSNCNKLVTLDMSGCDLRGATSVNNMFRLCSSLETIYANDNCNLTGLSQASSKAMFYKCTKLTGGNGTMISAQYVSNNESEYITAVKYARVDKVGEPGLFTAKQ